MSEAKAAFWGNRFFLINLAGSVLLNAIFFALIFLKIKPSADPITLHYNIYFGPDLIGGWREAYIRPVFGLCLILANFGAAWYFFGRQKILSYALAVITTLLEVFLLIGGLTFILINI